MTIARSRDDRGGVSSDRNLLYLATAKYKFDADNMAYFRSASGWQPGGPNTLTQAQLAEGAPHSFLPDSLNEYEVGYKSALFDHSVTLDLAVYDIEWKNIQVIVDYGNIGLVANAAEARSNGFEGSATWKPLSSINLSGSFAYMNAYLRSNVPSLGAVAGDPIPGIPRLSGHFDAEYRFPLAPRVSGFAGLTLSYFGRNAGGFSQSGAIYTPAYETLDLRAGFTYQRVDVDFYIRNVNNTFGETGISPTGNAVGPSQPAYEANIIQPRTFGLSVSTHF